MFIDIHVHLKPWSPCSMMTVSGVKNMINLLELDAICITDHHSIQSAAILKKAVKAKVFRGVEVSTGYGDFLVYSTNEEYLSTLTYDDTNSSLIVPCKSFDDIQQRDDSVTIWAHPSFKKFDKKDIDIIMDKIDGVELYNGNLVEVIATIDPDNSTSMMTKDGYLKPLKELADKYGKICTGASDAHNERAVMRTFTEFEKDIKTQKQFVTELKAGRIKARVGEKFKGVEL